MEPKIRQMAAGEEQAVYALVMRGFDELVRIDCTEEGAAEFTRAVRAFVIERQPGHQVTVAESDGRLLGMIDVRDMSHVCLFFVESGDRGCGVGRALLHSATEQGGVGGAGPVELTVNSSPWAVPAYERLGFTATAPVSETHGIRFVPMIKKHDNPRGR
jgi:GNAT superfamily N-acetyltransferase